VKLKITTEYINVDKEWLAWWIKNNGPNYGIKKLELAHEFTNKDPTSDVWATTRIEIIKPDPQTSEGQ
jgi:hypothetical protein